MRVRVFYSLLILSLFEVVLWSSPLADASGSSSPASQYFLRETGNFEQALGNSQDHFHAPVPLGIKLLGLALAVKNEAQATRREVEKRISLKHLDVTPSLWTTGLSALRDFFIISYDPDSGKEPAAAIC